MRTLTYLLCKIGRYYRHEILTEKIKSLAVKGIKHVRAKVAIQTQLTEQLDAFNYSGDHISY
jgi:hypothetical protein